MYKNLKICSNFYKTFVCQKTKRLLKHTEKGNNIEEKKIKSNSNLKDLIDNYYLNADKIINNAIEKNEVVTEAKSNILAVNIYDAVYYKNYIISKYFVMYGSIENKKIEYGDFVIETKEYKMLTKIYRI